MIVGLIRFLLGYVRFSISGEFPERLLNQLAANCVGVWGIKRNGKNISACIAVRDYLKIRRYRGKNRVRTKVTGRYGLPFALRRYRLRVGFAAGLALYIAALFLMSSFVWNIRVVGNQKLTEQEILEVCEALGLYEGAPISRLDTEQLRTRLALQLDDIAWASVNIEGVRATVNISEISGTKKDVSEPCNLVASRDGVVTALEVTSGTIAVSVGQTVRKGDLLVSGITEYKDGTYSFGASEGSIIAETERELELFVSFSQTETVRVGEPLTRRVISVFGLNIPLYLGSVKGNYETETDTARYDDGSMYLPVSLTATVFYKTEIKEFVISEAEAQKIALAELEKAEKQELENAEILSKNVQFESAPDGVRLTAHYKCRENIAEKDLLLILQEK